MRRWAIILGLIVIMIMGLGGAMFTRFWRPRAENKKQTGITIKLPDPNLMGQMPLEQALKHRRSVRSFTNQPLTLEEVGQLLWAAQGITRSGGYRSAPSAGALYPLEVYILAGEVKELGSGFYRYVPENHALENLWSGDMRVELSRAALRQEAIVEAPGVIVLTAIFERTTVKYGERGIQYVHAEVGSSAQNIYLQATAMELGTVYIGAFYDSQVSEVLGLRGGETPICIMPIGHPNE